MELLVIYPKADGIDTERLDAVLKFAIAGAAYQIRESLPDRAFLRGKRLLFAIPLGAFGINTAYYRLLYQLRTEPGLLDGCKSAFLIDGEDELFTKSTATELGFAVNAAGSALIGRPLVEGTGTLANFRIQADLLSTTPDEAYKIAARELVERLLTASFPGHERPEMLVLHASSRRTSNTMQLWEHAAARLGDAFEITEIGLRNGAVSDCSGCIYSTCLHFGEQGRCFYGGVMQDEVWPAIRRCNALMMVCPNYNDALSANLTAFINRMTGLFRQMRFYDKAVYAIIVSGYSGGDIVARQLISALNMNKSFYLPPRFAMLETANDPGEALRLPGIEDRLDDFAARIRDTLYSSTMSNSFVNNSSSNEDPR